MSEDSASSLLELKLERKSLRYVSGLIGYSSRSMNEPEEYDGKIDEETLKEIKFSKERKMRVKQEGRDPDENCKSE